MLRVTAEFKDNRKLAITHTKYFVKVDNDLGMIFLNKII
jgi:hypothetical protein